LKIVQIKEFSLKSGTIAICIKKFCITLSFPYLIKHSFYNPIAGKVTYFNIKMDSGIDYCCNNKHYNIGFRILGIGLNIHKDLL